jgi:5'(3')-deoxyribonucleotidase
MKKDFTVFLDMDGVLTNFQKGFIDIPSNEENLTFEQYNEKHGKNTAWKLIDKEGIEWWSEMEWMPDGKELWNYLKKYDPIILSATSRHPDSARGKVIWVNRELCLGVEKYTRSPKLHKWEEDSRMILNPQKFLFGNRFPNSILIDDTPKKIKGWNEDSRGTAIYHINTETTIRKFENLIKKL